MCNGMLMVIGTTPESLFQVLKLSSDSMFKLVVGTAEAFDGPTQPGERFACSRIWQSSSVGSSS